MWRDEIGITEMMLSYISEITVFHGWASWRNIVVEIISCHEQMRQCHKTYQGSISLNEKNLMETTRIDKNSVKIENATLDATVWRNDYHRTDHPYIQKPVDTTELESLKQETGEFHLIVDKSNNASGHVTAMNGSLDSDCQEISMEILEKSHVQKRDLSLQQTSPTTFTADIPPFGVTSEEQSDFPETIDNMNIEIGETSESSKQRCIESANELGFNCCFCNKQFRLESEKKIHEGRYCDGKLKMYKCSYCEKSFSYVTSRRKHERLHTDEKRNICRYCGKSFLFYSEQLLHENQHIGKKPYKCNICGKQFTWGSNMRIHERKHFK